MNIKVYYLHSYLYRSRKNSVDTSGEQSERFHQDIKTMENRCRGRWDTRMMAYYCWSIHRVCSKIHSRMSWGRIILSMEQWAATKKALR